MGRISLVWRLAVADLRRRRGEGAMLVLVLVATTATLTLGLLLHGQTADAYQLTRTRTAGPDVVVYAFPPQLGTVSPADQRRLTDLRQRAGVTAGNGPYPLTWASLKTASTTATAEVVGRDQRASAVDRPELTAGSWTQPGSAVLERSFAEALGAHVGDALTLNGRTFRVAGTAVSVAVPPYPRVCSAVCNIPPQVGSFSSTGLVWLTRADAEALATDVEPLAYAISLRLTSPADALRFADNLHPGDTTFVLPWQEIRASVAKPAADQRAVLLLGSGLIGVLAIASSAVLVGSRMARQRRRAGLLKAVGGTPGVVAGVLLAQYLLLALVATGLGLGIGRLFAPALADPGSGLLGTAQTPPITAPTVGIVLATALSITVVAALVPAVRAARISTVLALTDTARAPRRSTWLISTSASLPVPWMLGVRTVGRRPRRAVLSAVSVSVTVAAVVALMVANARLGGDSGPGTGLRNPDVARVEQLLLVITVMLGTLAAINAIFITSATVIDTRRASAVARTLGATPAQTGGAISVAQLVPALVGAVVGVPLGVLLVFAVGGSSTSAGPPGWLLLAVIPAAGVAIAAATAAPAYSSARRSVADSLRGSAD